MRLNALENFLLGPLYDLERFVIGWVADPPPTRVLSGEGLTGARRILADIGCELSHCTVENLHTFPVDMEPCHLFDLLVTWQQWPCSSFFPCLPAPRPAGGARRWTGKHRSVRFAYRWWKVIPVVVMQLRAAEKPHHIVYEILGGIGVGGYHSFLIGQPALQPAFKSCTLSTTLSIYTTFPRTRIFPEGLHDRVNYDIYRKLRSLARRGK
jgi:hypothetical protein